MAPTVDASHSKEDGRVEKAPGEVDKRDQDSGSCSEASKISINSLTVATPLAGTGKDPYSLQCDGGD